MTRKKIGVLLLFTLLVAFGARAQRTTSLRLNEVLVINQDNYLDDYGKKSPWIEIYNNSAGSVDLKGCFLTNEKGNPKKYMIPKGDVLTKIKPRQHILFWADNNPGHGTFHLNFTLDPDQENYLALYDSDGKTLIDEITVPAGQTADVSFGRPVDGLGDPASWKKLDKVTPSTNNVTLDSNEKIDNFKTNDSWGVGMTITAMIVVFTGLLLLFLVFKQIGRMAISISKRNAKKDSGSETTVVPGEVSGEVFAAIATALYEFTEDVHDMENTVLTIRKVARNYSPWSSKIYGLRETPKK